MKAIDSIGPRRLVRLALQTPSARRRMDTHSQVDGMLRLRYAMTVRAAIGKINSTLTPLMSL